MIKHKMTTVGWMRAICAVIGLLFFITWLAFPMGEKQTQVQNRGDGRILLTDGESVTVQFHSELGNVSEIAIQLGGVKESKKMTLHYDVQCGNKHAEKDDDISKATAESFRFVETEGLPSGDYQVTITASGEGTARLKGIENEDGTVTPTVRIKGETILRNIALLYMAGTMILLALIPVKGEKKNA